MNFLEIILGLLIPLLLVGAIIFFRKMIKPGVVDFDGSGKSYDY